MTQFSTIFARLAAPFRKNEVKQRTQGGKALDYITARTAMNRLDEVLGPENWWDEYTAHENSVLCKLTIRLPDETLLTKQDAGGYAGMADQGDDDKSGYSDAFKRACVKFGVGRYLYKDGVPDFVAEPPPPPAPAPEPISDNRTYAEYVKSGAAKYQVDAEAVFRMNLTAAIEKGLVGADGGYSSMARLAESPGGKAFLWEQTKASLKRLSRSMSQSS